MRDRDSQTTRTGTDHHARPWPRRSPTCCPNCMLDGLSRSRPRRLAEAWAQAAGSAGASHAGRARSSRGVLEVLVANSPLAARTVNFRNSRSWPELAHCCPRKRSATYASRRTDRVTSRFTAAAASCSRISELTQNEYECTAWPIDPNQPIPADPNCATAEGEYGAEQIQAPDRPRTRPPAARHVHRQHRRPRAAPPGVRSRRQLDRRSDGRLRQRNLR